MKNYLSIFILAFLIGNSGFAQEVNLLIEKIEQLDKLDKAGAYHDVIIYYYRKRDYDSAHYWASERLKFSEELGNDSVKTEAIIRIGQIFDKQFEFDKARKQFRKAIKFSKNVKYLYGQGLADIKMAISFYKEVSLDSSLHYYHLAEDIFRKIDNNKKLTVSYTGIGNCYLKKGELVLALDNYLKSLEIEQLQEDTVAMASSYQNIGAVYYYQDDHSQALKYFLKALKLKEIIGNEGALIGGYHNVGAIYKGLGDYDSSLICYRKALGLSKKLGRKEHIALSSTTIGSLYFDQNQYDSAKYYLRIAMELQEEINDKMSVIYTYRELGILEAKIGDWKTAIGYLNKAKNLGEEQGLTIELLDVYDRLYQIYEDRNMVKEAYYNYKKFVAIKDTLFNEEVQEKTIKMDMQYQFDKEMLEDSLSHAQEKVILEANAAKKDAEIRVARQQKYLLFGGLVLIVSFLLFVFNRLKLARKQKKLIEEQKQEVESAHELLAEHHQEIQDSIKYAKRIQDAIMPSKESLLKSLKNAFVLYLPKDVVAGDFFWMEKIDDVVYYAAADCTGHGVPGAMVSVVCSNALSKALLEEKVRDTGKLLDRTRELVINQLAKSGEEVKDGMDISLCALNVKSKTLQWSGANNPLWIIRNGELNETKPDKQPIGMSSISKNFTTHTIALEEEDTVYIFTDGYHDQFGGSKGKKFKSAQLKKLLIENQDLDINSQFELLKDTFIKWKGDLEQIDDVCVIGLRF